MLTPIGNDTANTLSSPVRDASLQQQAPGSPIAAPAETTRPTPPAEASASTQNNNPELTLTTQTPSNVQTTTLQSEAEARSVLTNIRESFFSNPSQAMLAQGEVQRDPAAMLLGSSPSF
ncbi:MAG: hypothetical protein HQL47_10385 [Gammaproteobacteria bacterium]|nr:hypothetical protein [Gammaproteobacteria bacterium]